MQRSFVGEAVEVGAGPVGKQSLSEGSEGRDL